MIISLKNASFGRYNDLIALLCPSTIFEGGGGREKQSNNTSLTISQSLLSVKTIIKKPVDCSQIHLIQLSQTKVNLGEPHLYHQQEIGLKGLRQEAYRELTVCSLEAELKEQVPSLEYRDHAPLSVEQTDNVPAN